MLRWLIGSPLLVLLVVAGAMYHAYGEVDPCRALAVDRARKAEHAVGGLPIEGPAEHWARLQTSQMSTGECARDLAGSAWDRAFRR